MNTKRMVRILEASPIRMLPAALKAVGLRVHQPKGAWIFRSGEAARSVYFVIDGEVRLCRFSKDGRELVLQRAESGDFLAEAAAYSSRYRCNAIASRATDLIAFPAAKIRSLVAHDPEFSRQWVMELGRQLHSARARLERVTLKCAAERVLHYLQTEGKGSRCEVVLPGSVKAFARELGLTHESLYRTLSRLEQQRLVNREDRRLWLGSKKPLL